MTRNITFYTPILYQSYIVCKQWSYIRVSYSCKNCIHTPVCIMVNQLLIRVSYSCKNCIHTPVCIMVNQLLHQLTNIKDSR